MKKFLDLIAPVVGAIAIVLIASFIPTVFASNGEPDPGTITKVVTYQYYPAKRLTGSGTVYSAAPRVQSGIDVSRVGAFNSADVFVNVDITGTGAITITPQFSADQVNWSDADYVQHNSSATPVPSVYRFSLNADGTNHVRVPISGEFLRIKIAYSGTLTPTVLATLRNN